VHRELAQRLAILGPRDEARGILVDLGEMLARCFFQTDVVGRPAAAQRVGIGIELFQRRNEKL